MSLDNKYIFSKRSRKKLEILNKYIFLFAMIFLFGSLFYHFKNIENLFFVSFVSLFLLGLNMALMIIEFSEKSKGKFYYLYIITFSICMLFSFIATILYFILTKYTDIGEIKLSIYQNILLINGMSLYLYALVIGIFLLFLDNIINTFLFPFFSNKLKFEIDIVSNRFAVDVLTYTIYVGTLFGIVVYVCFYSGETNTSFFAGINVTHVALATVGVVTFFWAAKSAKNKSIELDMTRTREGGRLFSDGSHLLSAPHNDKKYVGLSYLNKIASQSEGPLQKEAINLMADFILNANDITTANKPRIRAMEYLSDRLTTDFWDDDIDELIKLSSSELTESNVNYRFSQLNVVYENFHFSDDKKYLRYQPREEKKNIKKNNKSMKGLIAYNNCNFENYSGQNGIEKIILIYANDCCFKKCKIGIVKGYSKKSETLLNGGQEGEFAPLNNKFEQCDFSDSDGWNILRPFNRMEGGNAETIAENAFINCFYYSGHEPKGFVKERDGALLAEITSKEQFEELIGSSLFMQYAPPDDKD